MDKKKEIENVLFQIGKEAKLHKIDKDNIILEIDYEKYVDQLLAIMISDVKS